MKLAWVLAGVVVVVGGMVVGCGVTGGGSGRWGGEGEVERAAFVLLESRCLPCHGQARPGPPGMVDLRTREAAVATGALAPGSLSASRLAAVVGGVAEGGPVTMPPTGHELTPAEVAVLQRWLDAGARWPDGGGGALRAEPGAEPRSR